MPASDGQLLHLEQQNLYRLHLYIDGLITAVSLDSRGSPFRLTNDFVCACHGIAMDGLIASSGRFRDVTEDVHIKGSNHEPPRGWHVQRLMDDYCRDLNEKLVSGDLVHVGAYAMWRLNWIHPFNNGNGRVARAIAYFLMCMKHGQPLPPKNTVIEQIVTNRAPYYAALRAADEAAQAGATNLTDLELFLERCLLAQLESNGIGS